MVTHVYNLSTGQKQKEQKFEASLDLNERPHLKNKKQKHQLILINWKFKKKLLICNLHKSYNMMTVSVVD